MECLDQLATRIAQRGVSIDLQRQALAVPTLDPSQGFARPCGIAVLHWQRAPMHATCAGVSAALVGIDNCCRMSCLRNTDLGRRLHPRGEWRRRRRRQRPQPFADCLHDSLGYCGVARASNLQDTWPLKSPVQRDSGEPLATTPDAEDIQFARVHPVGITADAMVHCVAFAIEFRPAFDRHDLNIVDFACRIPRWRETERPPNPDR